MTDRPARGDEEHERDDERDDERPPRDEKPDWLELTASALSGLLVLGIVVFLAWDAWRPHQPVNFEVRVGSARHAGSSYYLPVHIRNTGDQAAKEVILHVEAASADSVLDESDITVDWVPGHSDHDAVAILRHDPRALRVTAEVRGFETP